MSFKKIFLTVYPFISAAFAFVFIKSTSSCGCLNDIFFPNITAQTQSGKYLLIRDLLKKLAIYLFVVASSIMSTRIITQKSSPATQEDSTLIKVLNRIIANTIEQSIIFFGLYIYFIIDIAGDKFNSKQLIAFASWFVVGRVIFGITYFLGSLISYPQIRGVGFALNVGTILLLVQNIFLPSKTILTNIVFGF